MDDIIKKTKKTKKMPPLDDMLSRLTEERNRKSIPNNFQDRSNRKNNEINSDFSNEKEKTTSIGMGVKIIDNTSDLSINKQKTKNSRIRSTKRGSNGAKYGIIIFSVLVILFFVLNIFSSVKIYLEPKVEQFSFNNEKFNAGNSASLSFEVMMIESSEKENVVFSEKKVLSTKAKGTVVLYNEYSTTPQKLLVNTRLSDDNGLVYMTDKAVNIPGYTKSGSKIIPGSVSVDVTASDVGDKYNSKLKDFKIVGFKGTSKYEKIYSRAKTDFKGGANGEFYTPTDKEKNEISTKLKLKLEDSLNKKIEAEVPEGYVSYKGSIQTNVYLDEKTFLSDNSNTNVTALGKMATIIFKKEDLRKEIIKKAYPKAEDIDLEEIDIPEIESFVFNFYNKDFIINKDSNSIIFELTGSGTLAWHPNKDVLAQKLTGVSKKEIDTVFKTDPGILRARVVSRPPWKRILPEKTEKIKIIEEISI